MQIMKYRAISQIKEQIPTCFYLKLATESLYLILIGTKTGKVSKRSSETGLVLGLRRPFHSRLYLRFLPYSRNRIGDGTEAGDFRVSQTFTIMKLK